LFRCGLSKLAEELNVVRIGAQHQAGSDSYLTFKTFWALTSQYFSVEEITDACGVLYGIGRGSDIWSDIYNKINYGNMNTVPSPENPQQIYSLNNMNYQYYNNTRGTPQISPYMQYNMYNNQSGLGQSVYQVYGQDYQGIQQKNYENLSNEETTTFNGTKKKKIQIKNGVN